MLKFRAMKDKIVCSKRHSQKLSQEELFSLTEQQHSLSRLNLSLSNKLHADVHMITDQDYKIAFKPQEGSRNSKKVTQRDGGMEGRMRTEYVQAAENMDDYGSNRLDFQQTTKKGSQLNKSVIQGSNFNKMVELLKEVIALKKMRVQCPRESAALGLEMRQKLELMKVLLRTLEDDSQKSLIDFYNEDNQDSNSPQSFHSQGSDDTYQPQSQRQAYELSERKDTNSTEEQEEITQIRYRRISPSEYQEGSIFQMFEEDREQESQPECQPFEERSQKAIVHLFSYEKENSIGTPLSKISQREEEYFSPESKQSSLAASLEYKKIFYLLQTSGKKQDTYRMEVSQFTSSKGSVNSHNESKDRSRCHQQLGEMISLLQNKYNRKIKIGVENLMDSLNLAIKDKSIKLRKR